MISQVRKEFHEGNYGSALALIDGLSEEELLEGLIYKSRIYEQTGEFSEGLKTANLAIQKCHERNNKILELGALSALAYNYYRLGSLEKGNEIFQKGEKIIQQLTIEEQNKGAEWIGMFRHIQGTIYIYRWELDLALSFLKKALDIRKQVGDEKEVSATLNNIGEVYRMKGEYGVAHEYYEQSLEIDKKFGNIFGIAISLENIGMINYNMGEYEKAYHHYQKSLEIVKEFDNKYLVSTYLFNLIRITLVLNLVEIAQQYLQELFELSEEADSKRVHMRRDLGEALILMGSKRLKDKMQAQEILEKLSKQDDVDFELKVVAMTHLCEILLVELKLTGDEDVFQEVFTLVDRLYKIGKQQKVYTLIVDSILLLAKFYLLKGNVELADDFLKQAYIYASEKGLTGHVERAKQERIEFDKDLMMWQELAEKSTTMTEKISRIKIEDYLEDIRKIFDL